MDALTDPMIASQFGRLERRIAELEGLLKAEQDSNHRLSAKELELEAENQRLRGLLGKGILAALRRVSDGR